MVYRGKDRQHSIAGKKRKAMQLHTHIHTHAQARVCMCVCVCTVAVEGWGLAVRRVSEEKQNREGGLAFERGKSIPVFARGIAL